MNVRTKNHQKANFILAANPPAHNRIDFLILNTNDRFARINSLDTFSRFFSATNRVMENHFHFSHHAISIQFPPSRASVICRDFDHVREKENEEESTGSLRQSS
jgi:hypothetical protein